MLLDSVQIGAADPKEAARTYRRLLGVRPGRVRKDIRRFTLLRGAVEIEPGGPGLHSIRFAFDGEKPRKWPQGPADFHGLDVRIGPGRAESPCAAVPADAVHAIDHVVVHTGNLDRAIALWRGRLGVRLALDRTFPNRGLRMLFFRSGGVTLEFVSSAVPAPEPPGPDRLYGVAYRVGDLQACRARLLTAGLDVSEIRPGHKPGTSVATVRSGTAGVPTLLIAAVP